MKPIFIQQRDQTDCGVACLLSVIRMYGGDATLETLREQSGTSLQGTSLLGLQQAAERQNIKAEAFEVDDLAEFRKEATFPCILHVVIDERLEHYVVCISAAQQKNDGQEKEAYVYQIIDPAKGIEEWTEAELLEKWQSRAVLCLTPTEAFEKVVYNKRKQRSWFLELIQEDKPLLAIAAGLGIILAVLGMATALFSQKLIDQILPNKENDKLWLGLGLLFILLTVRTGVSYLRTFFLLRQSKDFNNRLMGDFYRKLLHLPRSFFDTRKVGEIIARLNDTRRIQGLISYLAGNVVIDTLVFLVSAVFIFIYSWQIGLICLLALPGFGFLMFRFHKGILAGQKEVMGSYAASESHFVDAISGIEAVKASNKEFLFSESGKMIYGFFQEKIYQLGLLGNRYNWWNELLNALFIVFILSFSSFFVLKEQLKLGEMMAVFSISVGMIGATGRLVLTNIQIQEARVAFNRMYEFAGLEPEKRESGDAVPSNIEQIYIKDLTFRFAGKKALLENLNLKLEKGKLTVLMGEVGSGKSVLLRLLQRFRSYESGTIQVNNQHELNDLEIKGWRNRLSVVPQEIKLFSGTLLDNITLGNFMQEAEKAIDFCKDYGFDRFFEGFPQNYLTIVGEEGVNLSGGQRQLVGLARALYTNPQILLLDEPTSAMDYATERFVTDLMNRLKKDKIILMVTHRRNFGRLADQVIYLENGSIQNAPANYETEDIEMM
jgi:ABC-type bacteriocin/lantibiotic exporter with double-glycine peptidase domain